jgi:hypothetical protein
LGLEGAVKGMEDNGSFHNLSFSFKWAPSNIYQLHHLEILLHILYISYSQIMTLKEKVSNTSTNLSGY